MKKKVITRFEVSVVSASGRKFRKIFMTRVEAEDFAANTHQRLAEGGASKVAISRLSLVDNEEEIARLDRAAQHCPPGAFMSYINTINFLSRERAGEDEVVENYTLG